MDRTIIEDGSGPVRTLMLNRPAKLNCINWDMMRELSESLDRLEAETELKLVFLTGSGDRAFSSGGDLSEFRTLDERETARWIRQGQRLFDRIESLPAVTVAVLNGHVIGGGLELALAFDLRVATPATSFSSPELLHGWPPGWGALKRLPRVIGHSQAIKMIVLGEKIGSGEALHLGLVNWVVEKEKLEAFREQLIETVDRINPRLLAFAKSALKDGTNVNGDLAATLLARYR